jgi:hypothetical protein
MFGRTLSPMSITPKASQDLLDELESSKQSRLRAWSVLQRIRVLLSDLGKTEIPPPAHKTFDAEGEILEHALKKSLRIRNDAIKSLCSAVRRFRDATLKEDRKRRLPASSPGSVESSGSGGGSDSELSPHVRTLPSKHGGLASRTFEIKDPTAKRSISTGSDPSGTT